MRERVRAVREWLDNPEVIGAAECPILHRWTIWPRGGARHEADDQSIKLMVHHFLPNGRDRDAHDHPRPFWTCVLRGWYDNVEMCIDCGGSGWEALPTFDGPYSHPAGCPDCLGRGDMGVERMRPGMVRHRKATHAHTTYAGPRGAWTFVIMGRMQRRWGFWRQGSWWYWKEYSNLFGDGMRCD